ncbi:peptidylprolyl isomerase [Limnohabitans sp.]|uniref:peptidylprolyl isomerase n=1 Tax=Limnohabitans sp. TaxID=1907725 RepID=UPI0038B96FA1
MSLSAFRLPLLWMAVLGVSASSLAQPTPQTRVTGRNYIVAVVDAEPITNHDVNLRVSQIRQQLTQQGRSVGPDSSLLREALERLINEKALLQFAKETGVDVDNSTGDLAASATSPDTTRPLGARQEQREQLTLQRLTERNVPSRIKISDAEIDQVIREQQGSQVNTASDIELGHILVAVPETANEEEVKRLQNKAQEIWTRLQQGADFSAVAKETSDGAERDKGGLMGLRPSDRYPSLFMDATQSLKVGGLSAVVRSGAGFHILKLISKRSSQTMTVTETRVRHILLRPNSQLSQNAARAKLAEDRRAIEAGKADFAQLAQEQSQDTSSTSGGDLGWVGPGMFVPEFEQVMNKLTIGQMSDPTVSRFGVHLIQVLARREAAISEREVRDMVRNSLREKKFDEAYQLWVQEVRGRAYVEYRDAPQ